VVGAATAKLDASPLSVEGLQRLIGRLPAETRAQLAGVPAAMADALSAFLDGAMDEPSLARLASELGHIVTPWPAASEPVAHPALLRSELEAAWRSEASILRAAVEPATADAAEWTIRSWIACVDLSLSSMHVALNELRRVLGAGDAAALDAGSARRGSPLRVQALLMAAVEAVRRGSSQAVIADLVLRAFDEMETVLEQLRASGIHVDPFRGETLAERAVRTRRYAAHVRDALTDEDMRSLDEARLRQLR
jgi:hypothetical protein